MYAIIQNDLILGRTTEPQKHGKKLEGAIPFHHLRFDGVNIVNVNTLTNDEFSIDELGQKHIVNSDEKWQALVCKVTDALVSENGSWRVRNANDDYLEEKRKVDQFRQSEYTRRVRPYLEEAEIKKHMGEQSEYDRLMDLAVQEREKVQTEHPWPTPPTN
ncbi:hypothetical protein EK599_08525 [Vibrio sp. T187]|uniref:hypothetical protein n=1 Tax=Vibrio TaxID=662 RepID=UPI0010C9DF66|nr:MULTISPECIES: hypothetical protein [Vibrio]MBW3695738.1 hypothetical protein [Vibrio sp. T187]